MHLVILFYLFQPKVKWVFFRTMYGRAVIANTGKSPSVLENLKKFEAIYNSEACMMVLWIPPPTYAYLPIGLLYIAHST
jgi:hypothetical protein